MYIVVINEIMMTHRTVTMNLEKATEIEGVVHPVVHVLLYEISSIHRGPLRVHVKPVRNKERDLCGLIDLMIEK